MTSSDASDRGVVSSCEKPSGPAISQTRWQRSEERVLGFCLALAALMLVGVRLGPSLIGLRVFGGLDLLNLWAPYSSAPGVRPPTTSIYVSDNIDSIFPSLHQIAQRFWQGDIAGWSSLVGGGSALLGSPDLGVLTPGNWVFFVLPTWLAPAWAKLLEMAFAAIFCYLLVRRLDRSKLAACVAGLIYPLTGFMISWTNWPQVSVACSIPMLFWSIERFVQTRTARSVVPVALATALMLFGGFPAVAGQALYFGGGYALVRLWSEHGPRMVATARDVGLLLGALALGVGLTAIQLLPFLKGTLSSVDLSYRDAGFFVHDARRTILNTVFPGSFAGNLSTLGPSPMDLDSYVGSVVLLLAVLGLAQAMSGGIRRSAGLYFAAMILFIVGLLYFQGTWSDWIDHLPVFHGNPINRIRSQLGLPVAVLAAAGFDLLRGYRLTRQTTRARRLGTLWPLVAACAAVSVGMTVLGFILADPNLTGLSAHRGPDILLAVVPPVAITVLLVVAIRYRTARFLATIAVIFSISAQALAATSFYWPTSPRSQFYPNSAGISYLQSNLGHDRMATLDYAIRPNITAYYGLRTFNGHAFFPKNLHSLITEIDPDAFVGNTYSVFGPYVTKSINSPGLGRMGVRYMVGETPTVIPGQSNTALPILGQSDPTASAVGTMTLAPGAVVKTTISAGAVRGLYIPAVTTAIASSITVVLKGANGAVIASNKRDMLTGAALLPVPLAADSEAAASTPGSLTVEISSGSSGITLRTDALGRPVVQAVRPSAADSRVRLVFAADNLVIYQRLDYVARIHWAGTAEVITDDESRLVAVARSPIDPNGVILAKKPATQLAINTSTPQKFAIKEDSGDTIRVQVDTATAGYVVVADTVVGDFDATVDGRSREIVSADYAGGAVYVPAGSHEIALHYAPPGRSAGAKISAVSLIVLLLVSVPPLWWRRIPHRGSAQAKHPVGPVLVRKSAGSKLARSVGRGAQRSRDSP